MRKNLANVVTMIRVALAPLLVVLMALSNSRPACRYAALAVFALGAATDWLDGQIARRTKTVSKFGIVADPLADRLFIGTTLITLYAMRMLPLAFLVIVLGRDILMAAGYPFIRRIDASQVEVHWTGKVATAILFVALALLILSPVRGGSYLSFAGFEWSNPASWQAWGLWLFAVGMVWSLMSAGIYVSRVVALMRKRDSAQQPD